MVFTIIKRERERERMFAYNLADHFRGFTEYASWIGSIPLTNVLYAYNKYFKSLGTLVVLFRVEFETLFRLHLRNVQIYKECKSIYFIRELIIFSWLMNIYSPPYPGGGGPYPTGGGGPYPAGGGGPYPAGGGGPYPPGWGCWL